MINVKDLIKHSGTQFDFSGLDARVSKEDIKSLRESLNYSQTLFADLFGVSKKTVEKWEQGVNPVKGAAARLATLLMKDPRMSNNFINETETANPYSSTCIGTADYHSFSVGNAKCVLDIRIDLHITGDGYEEKPSKFCVSPIDSKRTYEEIKKGALA